MSISTTSFLSSSAARLLIERPQLPLAVYLEIVAHLQQVDGIQIELLPQTAPEFDYLQSQIGGLAIDCQQVNSIDRARVSEILNYYEHCYGAWTILSR